MKRREFIAGLCGAAAWPLVARAQQPERLRRIGILMAFPEGDAEGQAFVTAFRDGLRQLGWFEGRNLQIDRRWATPSTLSQFCASAKKKSPANGKAGQFEGSQMGVIYRR